MTVLERMEGFARQYQKEITVSGRRWRYYRLGAGRPLLWLTGGLRRAAFGYAFMERLAVRHCVIAPDYPPVLTISEFITAFDAILQNEGVQSAALGGQSYGGLLAQAYLARRPQAVERLVLSSSGPADYGKTAALVDDVFAGLARLLPEKSLINLLAGGLFKIVTVPEAERGEWREAVFSVMHSELSRADAISHFAVPADLIRKGWVRREAYQGWTGRIIVLSAANDPTQSAQDIPRYEKLFGRRVEVIRLGEMGHTAALFDPDQYVQLLEQALA